MGSVGAGRQLIFFDGICGLCNRFVDFVLQRDKREQFVFASLQGKTAAEHAEELAKVTGFVSIALVDQDGAHFRSEAVLRVLRGLGGHWALLASIGYLIPAFIREHVYCYVAQNRYRWFGRLGSCRVPRSGERGRLLP